MTPAQAFRAALLKVRTLAAEHLVLSADRLTLAAYTFIGLACIDFSWLRIAASGTASSLLLHRFSVGTPAAENEVGSWRWSSATTRAVVSGLLLSVLAILPVVFRRATSVSADPVSIQFIASIMFSFIITVALYTAAFLDTPAGIVYGAQSLEALKLEHQSCLTLYQTLATASMLLFLGTLFTPVMNLAHQLGEITLAKIAWAFYCFDGIVIWLLRPCMARAKYIRCEIEKLGMRQIEARSSAITRSPELIAGASPQEP